MPREYLRVRSISEMAIRTFAGVILMAAILGLFVLGGVPAVQQFLLMLAVVAGVVGTTFMLFWYQLVKLPAWPLFLLALGGFAAAAYVYSGDIVKALGFQLLPLAIVDGRFTLTPTILLVMFLCFLLLGVVCAQRRHR